MTRSTCPRSLSQFPSGGGESSFSFTAASAWSIYCPASWLTLSPASGEAGNITVHVTASENTTGEARTAEALVKVPDSGEGGKITIYQDAASLDDLSPASIAIPSGGGTGTISFTAASAWSASASDSWLSISPSSGEAGKATITVTVVPNATGQTRTAEVAVRIQTSGAGGQVSVMQDGASINDLSPASLTIPADGGSSTFSFTAEAAWTAAASDSWLSISPASGAAGKVTVTVTGAANATGQARTARISVRIQDAGTSSDVTVSQGVPPAEMDADVNGWGEGAEFEFTELE